MTEQVTLTSFQSERRYEIKFRVEGAPLLCRERSGERPYRMLPTVLDVWYWYGGKWDPDAEKGWRSAWILRGRRVLKSGALSDKEAANMQDFDFPTGVPAWITDAVERHHPEGGAR